MKILVTLLALAVAVLAIPNDETEKVTLEQIENDGPMMNDIPKHGGPLANVPYPVGDVPSFGALPNLGFVHSARTYPYPGVAPVVGALVNARVAAGYPYPYYYDSHLRGWLYPHSIAKTAYHTSPYLY